LSSYDDRYEPLSIAPAFFCFEFAAYLFTSFMWKCLIQKVKTFLGTSEDRILILRDLARGRRKERK
jgi:hypothetical protein